MIFVAFSIVFQFFHTMLKLGFPGGSPVKNPPASPRDVGLIPESGRSPGEGKGNPLQYSCLENPMDRGAWRAAVHGVAGIGQDLATKQQMLMLFFMSKVHKIEGWVGKKSGFWRFQPEVKGHLADSVVDGLLLLQESCGWKYSSPQCWALSSTGSSPRTRRRLCPLKMDGGGLG